MFRVLVLMSGLITSVSMAQDLKMCVEDKDYTPYINLESQGILTHLVAYAAAEAEISVEYYHRPWKRCLYLVQHGEYDAMMAVSWTEERAKNLAFPVDDQRQPRPEDKIWLGEFSVFVHKNSQLRWDGETFTGLKVGLGTPLGYVSEKRLESLNALYPGSIPLDQGVGLVALGRLDGYVVEREIGWQAAKLAGVQSQLQTLPIPFHQLPWYVAFSPAYYQVNKFQVEKFWRALGDANKHSADDIEHLYGVRRAP